MSDPIQSALILDTSASMTYSGYVDITKIDSKAFVDQNQPGDSICVSSYDENGRVNLALTECKEDQSVRQQANQIIQGLSFTGSCTNMGGGIQAARGQMDGASSPKALILLSDGYQNCGTGPLGVLPDYPVYSCAMGPKSDQNLMQQIAENTNGKYYYAPYISDMMKIYNDIHGQVPQTQVLKNDLSQVGQDYYAYIPVTVGEGQELGQFTVVWSSTSVKYTSSNTPTGSEVSITLVNPEGKTLRQQPAIVGEGYVIFNVPTPQPGEWHVQIMYATGPKQLDLTTGVFERGVETGVDLTLDAPTTVKAGEPLHVKAHVTDDGAPVTGVVPTAEVASPVIGVDRAIEHHRDALDTVGLSEVEPTAESKEAEDRARLGVLRQRYLPRMDILPTRYRIHTLTAQDDHYTVPVDTTEKGSYTVTVNVSGHSPHSDTPFERTELLSVRVV